MVKVILHQAAQINRCGQDSVAFATFCTNNAKSESCRGFKKGHADLFCCHFDAAIAMDTRSMSYRPQDYRIMRFSTTSQFFTKLLPGVALVAGALSTSPVTAQQLGTQSWVKICSKIGETDICNVKYDVIANTGQLITGVNLLQSKGKTNRRIFQVAVPSGRYIPEGIKVQVDSGNTNTLPYSLCLPDRCLAEIQLSEGLVNALKAGGELTLTSTNFRAAKNPVKVSLKGFTAAFDGPPLKRNEVENRQKQLAAELQKKAKETADKLKAAQDAAKTGN